MYRFTLASLVAVVLIVPMRADTDEANLRKAVTLYASFDDEVKADKGQGKLATRFNHPSEKGKFVVKEGISSTAFRIARDKGIHGGALECVDVLPNNVSIRSST